MKIKNFIKVVGIILLVFIILMLIHSIRNYMIVRELQNKISKYENSTNYHIKSETTEPNGIIMTVNSYRKDDKQATFIERKNMKGKCASS